MEVWLSSISPLTGKPSCLQTSRGNDRLSGQTGYSKNEIQICVSGLAPPVRVVRVRATWVLGAHGRLGEFSSAGVGGNV